MGGGELGMLVIQNLLIYFYILLLDGTAHQGGEKVELGRGTLMGNLCLISHR